MLGTVPDFTDTGPGVRIDDVVEGSPAARSGLRTGDRLLAIDDELVTDLRGYALLLRQLEPGAEVVVKIERDGETLSIRVKLVAR